MKNIKKVIIYSLFLVAGTSFSACDIERFPYTAIADEEIRRDPVLLIDELITGTYSLLRTWSDWAHRVGEFSGDNLMIRGVSTGTSFLILGYANNPASSFTDIVWNNSYATIAQASNIINMVPRGINPTVDNRLGEAHFIRGMVYFHLVRVYGRPFWDNPDRPLGGVPIVNGTPDDVSGRIELPDRSTVREVYQQVLEDLYTALELLTIDNGNTFASRVATQALLSRIYLFKSGTYENPNVEYAQLAIYYATQVINSGRHYLLPRERFMRYPRYTPAQNNETIFAVRRTPAEGFSGGFNTMYNIIGGVGWGEIFASASYLDLLHETGRNDWFNNIIVDARAAFIEPQWAPIPAGQTEADMMRFRFIRRTYNAAGTHTGFLYLELPFTESGGVITARHLVRAATDNVTEIVDYYVLTPVDATQGIFSIDFKRRGIGDDVENVISTSTITGFIDRAMRLNLGLHPEFFTGKNAREGIETQLHSCVISRLAEIYLNKAEAAVKVGNLDMALEAVNIVRERSLPGQGYSMATFATNPRYFVDKERRLELAFQGERRFDIFRLGDTLVRNFPGAHPFEEIAATDPRVALVISNNIINAHVAQGNTLTPNPQ